RNMLLGHAPIDLPNPFWLTQAQRSGTEFGWPLLALFILLAYVYWGPLKSRPNRLGGVVGLTLVMLALLPSIVSPHRLNLPEWAAFFLGVAVLSGTLLAYMRPRWSLTTRSAVERVAWAWLLAAPYFVTWFYSYSYHYRLSFTIVP